MAFEKMTAEKLFNIFWENFRWILGQAKIKTYQKIGARMLRIEIEYGFASPVLYFLWYDENNWNLGTKPYRNRPKKQIYSHVRKSLAKGEPMINAFEKAYGFSSTSITNAPVEKAGLHEGFGELITNGNDVITGCNQWANIEQGAEAIANQPLEPIDWVKEDPEVIMASYPPSAE